MEEGHLAQITPRPGGSLNAMASPEKGDDGSGLFALIRADPEGPSQRP